MHLLRLTASVLLVGALAALLTSCSPRSHPYPVIAVTASANEPAPSTAAIHDALASYAQNALEPGDGRVEIVTRASRSTVDLTPMRGDEVESDDRAATRAVARHLKQLDDRLAHLADRTGTLDLVGLLDAATRSAEPGSTIYVVSSGFSTVSPLDLRAAGDWIGRPAALIDAIPATELPDAASDTLVFIGLGQAATGSPQHDADPATRRALTTLVRRLCQRSQAAACRIDPTPLPALPPAAATPTPTVPIPNRTTPCIGTVTIDTSTSFQPYSAKLHHRADRVLQPIADRLRQCAGPTVLDAIGHSASLCRPAADSGRQLELDRANAILQRLHELGAPTAALGHAHAGGQQIDNCPGGAYNPALAAMNRVVTLRNQH